MAVGVIMKSIKSYNYTDLTRLHTVVSMDNPGRGAGRTFAECHIVAGVMETTSAGGVICLVPKHEWVTDIMRQMVFKVFPDHGISFHKTVNQDVFIFYMPDKKEKQVQFVVSEQADEHIINLNWPIVRFTEYKHAKKRVYSMYEVGEDGEN